ncbi:hypothetical protein C7M84_003540 [Penaeus vannamei]|uniref:Uncharacterized protein n=1 Tax=Penaeus vannamei TaxID=6689 RepID=A0A423TMX1_PENVA|nr:hypothetical protein C7M84_003540 [Penaeus vannamei]
MGSIASKAFRRASSITVIIDVFRARASKRWRRGAILFLFIILSFSSSSSYILPVFSSPRLSSLLLSFTSFLFFPPTCFQFRLSLLSTLLHFHRFSSFPSSSSLLSLSFYFPYTLFYFFYIFSFLYISHIRFSTFSPIPLFPSIFRPFLSSFLSSSLLFFLFVSPLYSSFSLVPSIPSPTPFLSPSSLPFPSLSPFRVPSFLFVLSPLFPSSPFPFSLPPFFLHFIIPFPSSPILIPLSLPLFSFSALTLFPLSFYHPFPSPLFLCPLLAPLPVSSIPFIRSLRLLPLSLCFLHFPLPSFHLPLSFILVSPLFYFSSLPPFHFPPPLSFFPPPFPLSPIVVPPLPSFHFLFPSSRYLRVSSSPYLFSPLSSFPLSLFSSLLLFPSYSRVLLYPPLPPLSAFLLSPPPYPLFSFLLFPPLYHLFACPFSPYPLFSSLLFPPYSRILLYPPLPHPDYRVPSLLLFTPLPPLSSFLLSSLSPLFPHPSLSSSSPPYYRVPSLLLFIPYSLASPTTQDLSLLLTCFAWRQCL